MREHSITTPSSSAIAPPESPVPAPRGTKGTPCARQARTTRATSVLSLGSTTALGSAPCTREAVGLVDQQLFGPREHRLGADDLAQRGDESRRAAARRLH